MNTLLKILVLVLAVYGGYAFYQEYWVPQEKAPVHAVNKSTTKAPALKHILCPDCEGLGKLIDTSGAREIGYSCPICNGMGKVRKPHDKECPYCKGFGRIKTVNKSKSGKSRSERSGGSRILAQTCPLCNGTGDKPRSAL